MKRLSDIQIQILSKSSKLKDNFKAIIFATERAKRNKARKQMQPLIDAGAHLENPSSEAYKTAHTVWQDARDYENFSADFNRQLRDSSTSERLMEMLVFALADFDYPDEIEEMLNAYPKDHETKANLKNELTDFVCAAEYTSELGTIKIVDLLMDQVRKEYQLKQLVSEPKIAQTPA